MPRDLRENFWPVFKTAAADNANGVFSCRQTAQSIEERLLFETALRVARDHIRTRERARVEVVEKIGDERPKAGPPRRRRQRPSRRCGDQNGRFRQGHAQA